MSDIIRKKGAKFIKQLEKQLNERGYELVSYEFGSRKKHGTITVKNPETQEIVESTFSPKSTPRAVKNIVSQISGMFKGRKRRGQGEFKLSLDGPQKEEWFGVLKAKKMTAIAIEAFNAVMADGQERTMSVILSEIKYWFQQNRPDSAQGYIPNRNQLGQHISKRRDIQKEKRRDTLFYRKV